MNRKKKEVAYCQIDAQMSEKCGITRDYYKSKWEILRSQIMREQALQQKTSSKVSLLHRAYTFSHLGSKTFCLLSANLAAPGNITKNNVS